MLIFLRPFERLNRGLFESERPPPLKTGSSPEQVFQTTDARLSRSGSLWVCPSVRTRYPRA
jgi:hypothetical protein